MLNIVIFYALKVKAAVLVYVGHLCLPISLIICLYCMRLCQQAQPMQFQPCHARFCNGTLTLLRAHLPTCLPAGSLVQRSVERVTLEDIPLDLGYDAVGFFEHVKELEYKYISEPHQVGLAV